MNRERELQQVSPRPARTGTKSARPNARSERAPEFRINREDLVFLRSIGIDPTRRHR